MPCREMNFAVHGLVGGNHGKGAARSFLICVFFAVLINQILKLLTLRGGKLTYVLKFMMEPRALHMNSNPDIHIIIEDLLEPSPKSNLLRGTQPH